MTLKKSHRLAAVAATLVLASSVAAGAATALAGSGGDDSGPPAPRPVVSISPAPTAPISKVNVTPATPRPEDPPKELFEKPFVDGFLVSNVAIAAQVLSFRPAVPISLGNPVKVFIHRYYRPQALGLVFNNPVLGRFTLTQERINIPESVQRRGLEQRPAHCDPATGCVGSWTMQQLGAGSRALVISSAKVTAVVWIHAAGIRFQLIAPASSMPAPAALGLATIIDAAA